jgi:hypothetical protein
VGAALNSATAGASDCSGTDTVPSPPDGHELTDPFQDPGNSLFDHAVPLQPGMDGPGGTTTTPVPGGGTTSITPVPGVTPGAPVPTTPIVTTPTTSTTTVTTAPITEARISVNGSVFQVEKGSVFPSKTQVFQVKELGPSTAVIELTAGKFTNGSVGITLKKGEPVKLVNQTGGAETYELELISTGSGDTSNNTGGLMY